MGRTAHTICWGIAIGIGSLLPPEAPTGPRAGHPVHAAQVTSGTPTPPAPPATAPPAQSSTPAEVPPKAGDVPDAANVTQPAGTAPALPPFTLAWDDQAIPLIQSPEMIVTARLVIISGAAHPTEARLLTDGTRAWGGAPAMRQLVADSGRVYGLDDRSIHAIDEATGAPRWTAAADAGTRYLSASGDQVVVASADAVRSLRAEDGGERWRIGLSSPPVTAVAIGSGRLAVGLEDRSVMVFDAATGAEQWRTVMDEAPLTVTAAGDRWLIGVPHLALCALRDSSGAFDWCTLILRVPSVGRPYVSDKKIYLALLDGTLRTLDRSGTLARTDRLVGRPATGPLPLGADLAIPLVSNEFIVASPDGRLSRVPAPATAGVYSRVGVASESRSIVTLGVSLSQQMTLSVSKPKD